MNSQFRTWQNQVNQIMVARVFDTPEGVEVVLERITRVDYRQEYEAGYSAEEAVARILGNRAPLRDSGRMGSFFARTVSRILKRAR